MRWKEADQFDSEFGTSLSAKTDVQRHTILVNHEIITALMNNPKGLRNVEVARMLRMDRKNIAFHLKKLLQSGYVMRRGGVQGRYFITDKIYKNPVLSSYLMGKSFVLNLLEKPNLILGDLKANPIQTDFATLFPYLVKKELGLPHVMFEFATKIGAYIMYTLIQAMNPSNQYLQGEKYMRKDLIIQEVVKYSIRSVVPELLSTFKDSIHMELESLIGDEKDPFGAFIDYQWTIPQFLLKKETIDELMHVYSALFPTMFSELEKLKKSLPRLMSAYEYHMEYLRMQEKFQKHCRHTYVDDVSQLFELDGKKYWTKYHKSKGKSTVHCVKCHHTTYRKFITNCYHKPYQKFLK